MKVVFLGSSSFAVESLKALQKSDYDVVAVLTQPDRKVGRKREIQGTPVKEYAVSQGLEVLQPEKPAELYDVIAPFEPDFIVVVAYGLLLGQDVIDLPTKEILNVHGSMLPDLRGAAPIHFALMRGDTETGVCVMRVVKRLDAGPVYACGRVEIDEEDDFTSLHDRMAGIGAHTLVDVMDGIVNGTLQPEDQDENRVTYCSKITKDLGEIDFVRHSFKEIRNRFRALKDWPGLKFEHDRVRFGLKTFEKVEIDLKPGVFKFVDGELFVGTKKGSIKIVEFQPESKRVMQPKDFLLGNPDFFGTEQE
jgi:methionyl-tRNA formyltransferase